MTDPDRLLRPGDRAVRVGGDVIAYHEGFAIGSLICRIGIHSCDCRYGHQRNSFLLFTFSMLRNSKNLCSEGSLDLIDVPEATQKMRSGENMEDVLHRVLLMNVLILDGTD